MFLVVESGHADLASGLPVSAERQSDHLRHFVQRISSDRAAQSRLVDVIIETDQFDSNMAGRIAAHAGTRRYSSGRRHEVRIPAGRIQSLLNTLPASAYVRLPYPHEAVAVTSQGVGITGAADMHQLSHQGSGVKVGIIDLGFANYTSAQATGDLPASLSITDYSGTGTGGISHGTQVAEIVHDMAPGAELYLAKVATSLQLEQATNDMIAAGVQVINHSVAWFGANFYDGSGPLCSITSNAESAGVLWLNAMGNSRTKHFLGNFSDSDGDLRHEFSTGQNYNTIDLTAGGAVTLVLNWDAFPVTSIDYNLYLYNGIPGAGGAVVASSTSRQSGNSSSVPYEALDYTASVAGTYYIVVTKTRSSTAHVPLTLFSIGPNLSVQTYTSSLAQPADCASVMSVGATNLSSAAESFSSEGPSTDGRQKPEVSAPNRVQTSMSSSFNGTSAASPHAAGAAALLIEQTGVSNVAQLRSLMISQVYDVSPAGLDYRTGYGRISLDADGDSVNHDDDNCPITVNTDQLDTDEDGLGDLCDDDIDGDGLLNTVEEIIGSNPLLADSDGDGLNDGDEVNIYGTSPVSSDTDNDGLSDYEEIIIYGLSPTVSNSGDIAPLGAADGELNLADLLVLYRFIENMESADAKDTVLADLNQDGVLDIQDVLRLRQLLGY